MITNKQLIANRRNAQNSTGPKTTQGKIIASKNSLTHGLTTKKDVIFSESQTDFDIHRQNYLDELDPQGPIESMLAERLIKLSWRLRRTGCIQNQTIDTLNSPAPPSPLAKLTQSIISKYNPDAVSESSIIDSKSQPLPLGQMAVKDFAGDRVLDRLLMYERRIENSLFKTLLELQRLRLLKNFNQNEQEMQNEPIS